MSHHHGVMGIAGGNNLRPPRRGKHVQWASTESHSGGTSGDASPLKATHDTNGYHVRNGTAYPHYGGAGGGGGGGDRKYPRPAPGLIDDGGDRNHTVPLKAQHHHHHHHNGHGHGHGNGNGNGKRQWERDGTTHGSRKKKNGYLQHQNVDTDFHEGSASESTDDETNSDDTMMEKPRVHKYSNQHGQHHHAHRHHDDDEKLMRPPTAERAERRRKKRKERGRSGRGGSRIQQDNVDEAEEEESVEETTGDYPYHDITNSEFGKLQKAITNAKTKSDFEKLESIIKHGQIPPDNWHGKGAEYERLRSEQMEQIQDALSKQSSLYKMSDGSTAESSQYNGLPQMATATATAHDHKAAAKKRGQKLVALDEAELADKLQQLRNGRKNGNGREPGMRAVYVSEY